MWDISQRLPMTPPHLPMANMDLEGEVKDSPGLLSIPHAHPPVVAAGGDTRHQGIKQGTSSPVSTFQGFGWEAAAVEVDKEASLEGNVQSSV